MATTLTKSSASRPWGRVSRRRPCPVCGRPDWCLYVGPEDSPAAVICARVESPKRCGEAGWLHVLRNDGPTWAPWRRTIRVAVRAMGEGGSKADEGGPESGRPDCARLAADCQRAVEPEALARLSLALGVSAESLRRLGVGWSAQRWAWTFPMSDAAGRILGIRLRLSDGRKLSVRGGKEGLFLPSPHPHPKGEGTGDRLLIAEGPTDTAAITDLGLHAVGRPSCAGGVALLAEVVRRDKPAAVAIAADRDEPGQRGAERLATSLAVYCGDVRIVSPPAGVKDAREWVRRGATRADVLAALAAAPVRRLSVSARMRGKAAVHGL